MKIIIFLFTSIFFFQLKAQEKIIEGFNTTNNYFFDKEQSIPLKTKADKNIGIFTIYYIPKGKENNYYENFLKNNNISFSNDELNDSYYFDAKNKEKIKKKLQKELTKESNFYIIGSYISKKYIKFENDDESTLNYPYSISIFKKNKGKWIRVKELNIKNYEDDVNFSKKEYLLELFSR